MTVLVDNVAIAAFCDRLRKAPYIAIDTEFMRERTFWPRLCLVQIAVPDEAAAIDPLAEGVDLQPLYDLLADPAVIKVFHAARQDVELFFHLTGRIPLPLFDTQVAAMVCGFGESASYEILAQKFARASVDKSSRFTDWSRRPLTRKQIDYALSDVLHLRVIYEKLRRRLDETGRESWLADEMAILTDKATYRSDPEAAWRRLKPRSSNARFLNVLKSVAAWREREAQARDLPRNRLLRDEAIAEIAAHPPSDAAGLRTIRMVPSGFAEGRLGPGLLAAVAEGLAAPADAAPKLERPEPLPNGLGPLTELLRVLLKMKCDEHGVAQKLVAAMPDLERIAAADDAEVPALSGWRREVFGDAALALKQGRLALAADGKRVRLIGLPGLQQ
ncbi:MAG: ribonuclease D [Alphaproteobacteria bacterium]|nr:ribonuclease D [Alphaproteobacteria bacterium]